MAKPVTIKILGDASGLSKALGTAEAGLGKLGKAAGAALAGLGVAGAGLAVATTKSAVAFESSMSEVFTLLPGMSADAMDQMGDDVLALSKKMGVLPDDVVPALYDALSAGVPKDNVFAFIEDASKLAIGGSITTGESVDILTTSVNAWASAGLTAGEASDYLFTTVKLGKTTMAELNASLSQVAPTASALGVGLDEVGAGLAVLTAGGMPTANAATAMNAAIAELASTGSKASNAFADMNDGQTFNELIESGGTLTESMQLIAASGESVFDMFGSIQARKGVLALTANDAELLAANMLKMSGAAGATDAAFGTMNETTARSMETVKANLAAVSIEIGNKLIPVLSKVTDYVIENFPKWREAIEPVITAVVDGIKMFASVLRGSDADDSFISKFAVYLRDIVWPLVIDIKDWIVENWPAISAVFLKVATFIVEEVMPRVVKAIRFVAKVIGDAVAFVVEHWPEISAAINKAKDFIVDEVFPRIVDAVEFLRDVFQAFVDRVKEFWAEWGEEILATATRIFDLIKEYIGGALDQIKAAFDIFKALFEGDWKAMWDGIVDFIKGFGTRLKATFLIAWEVFKLAFKFAVEGVKTSAINILNGLKTYITELPGNLKDAALGGLDALVEAGTELGAALFDAIKEQVKGIPGMVGGFLKDAGTGFLNAATFGIFGGDDGPTTNSEGQRIVPEGTPNSYRDTDGYNVALYQHGGNMRPGLALVGERGPELLNIPNSFGGGSVTSNEELGGMMGGVTVNVSTNADPVEIGAAVAWELRKAG